MLIVLALFAPTRKAGAGVLSDQENVAAKNVLSRRAERIREIRLGAAARGPVRPSAGAQEVFSFVTQFGSRVSDAGGLNTPAGVAVDQDGNVYVSDLFNGRVQKFTANGAFLAQFGSFGLEPGQFQQPAGLAVDGAGNVYVGDPGRVEKFDSNSPRALSLRLNGAAPCMARAI